MKLLYFIGSLYCLNGESCFLAVRLEAKHIKRNKSNNEVRNIMPLNVIIPLYLNLSFIQMRKPQKVIN